MFGRFVDVSPDADQVLVHVMVEPEALAEPRMVKLTFGLNARPAIPDASVPRGI